MQKYYLEEVKDVLEEVQSNGNGLTSKEAEERLAKFGKNKLEEADKETLFQKFVNSIMDPMILMLLGAALLQAIVNALQMKDGFQISEFADVIIILVVVIINTIMSLVQETKAEGAMDALMQMTASTSKVLRDGKVEVVKSEDICVGDVIVFEAGDTVPADCRILESHSLKAEEAALTGESVPVNKLIDTLMLQEGKEDVTLGDRKNMLYNGSTVVYGRGKAVVTAIGMDTEVGKIADALNKATKELTPLQKKMAELSAFLTKLVIIICVIVFAVGVIENIFLTDELTLQSFGTLTLDTFIAAIALAVAAIPEGMPAVVTVILSIGVSAMAKRQALIRKLTVVETLGCTNIICSDKTGTLTQNKMTVVEQASANETLLAKAMALCSDATIEKGADSSVGEPTEAALVNYANKLGMPKYELEEKAPRVGEAPFDSMRKMMSTIHEENGKFIQYTKGALDVMLDLCTSYLDKDGTTKPMDEAKKEEIQKTNKIFASKALRVLCAAYREYDKKPEFEDAKEIENDLIYIGVVGMIDPCRPEVYAAIEECRKAGIRPIMITGDHKDTAVAIGKDLGIIKEESEAIEGYKLDAYSDEELREIVPQYSVYARVQPEHKTRIVNAWQARGMVTAMTGDGVNDAPSIKSADIGIGMGITGTDVTKSAADMVLADDNFATIVNAVEEGRKIYDNICKVIQFQLATNLSEVVIMFIASILNFTILSPVCLLWINMVTDSLPALALGMEKAEGDVMNRKPRNSNESIFANGLGIDVAWQGIYLAIIEIAAYMIGYHLETGSWNIIGGETCVNAIAMAFLVVNFAELCDCINMRSTRHSIFSKEMFQNFNWWMLGATIVTTALTLIAIYMPGLQEVFGIMPGTFQTNELLICIALALSTFPVFEIGKVIQNKVIK